MMGLMLDKITLGYDCIDGNSCLNLMITPILGDKTPDLSQKSMSTSEPAYLSKHVYSYLVSPGKGRTAILTKAILDIQKCNRDAEDMNRQPVILLITFENDTKDIVASAYDSISRGDAGVLIIRAHDKNEINTKEIRATINNLIDAGGDVVGLIVDSVRSVISVDDKTRIIEKIKFRSFMNELLELALSFDIPCITTWQLKRNEENVINGYFQIKDKERKASEEIFDKETIDEFKVVLGKYLPDKFTGVQILANYR